MSGLLTQVIRRQALMMVPRRSESALLIAGPPMNKVTNKVWHETPTRSSLVFTLVSRHSSRRNYLP